MIEWEASESAFADSQGQIRLPRSRDDSDVSTDDEGGWLPDSFVDFNSQPEYHSTESGKGTVIMADLLWMLVLRQWEGSVLDENLS